MANSLMRYSFVLIMLAATCSTQSRKKRLLLHSEMDYVQEINNLKSTIAEMQTNFTSVLNTEINKLKAEKTSSGSVYVRWGRNVCPASAIRVYKGYMAGKHYNNKGSGTDTLCLPDDPTWSHYADGLNDGWNGYVFGTEMEVDDSQHIFKYAVYNEDMPCAVCQSERSATVMIPGRNSCYGNWTAEYDGYIMSNYHNHYGTSYVCVDQSPEFIPGGVQNVNEHLLYLVEARCGVLPCPPYVEGRELACVVCSK